MNESQDRNSEQLFKEQCRINWIWFNDYGYILIPVYFFLTRMNR